MKKDNQIYFPENFFWGAATSSHQVEGNNHNDWSEWEKTNAERLVKEAKDNWQKWQQEKFPEMFDPQNYISGRVCDHYNRFAEDFGIAKFLGHNAHRFSIEWSRIEPEEGKFDDGEIEHYRQVLRVLKNSGLEPFVTLWHFSLPVWFSEKGGFKNKNSSEIFARYCGYVVEKLGGMAQFWITINEPEYYAQESYLTGMWPPQKKSRTSQLIVIHNLIRAHCRAYKVIKKLNQNAQVGIAKNNIYFEAYKDRLINRALKKFKDWWWNFYFLHQIRNCQDFIGLNHYFHNRIHYGFNKNEHRRTSDMGWELYPQAIYHVLVDLKRYQKPIYITENGLADAQDKKRGWFIFETLKNVSQAIEEGVDVRGYLHWSLMDNVELDKGFWPRFGLLEIDYKTLERKIRPSAKFYRDICMANGITEDILSKYKNLINV